MTAAQRRHVVAAVLVAVLAAVAAVLIGTAPASAHTALVSATPSAGGTLGAAPGRVELQFTSTVQARLAQVVVEDASGRDHVVGPVTSFDSRVVADLGQVGPGRYHVAYRVVAPDGHPIVGAYTFTVATGATASVSGRSVVDQGSAAPDGGRPWLVPLLGLLAVVTAVGLRVAHGVRRAAAS